MLADSISPKSQTLVEQTRGDWDEWLSVGDSHLVMWVMECFLGENRGFDTTGALGSFESSFLRIVGVLHWRLHRTDYLPRLSCNVSY